MTNEIEMDDAGDTGEVDMEDTLTPETFSLFDALDGVTYPTDEINIYLDEKSLSDRGKMLERLADSPEGSDVAEKITKKLVELDKKIAASRLHFELRGVDDDLITGCKDLADAKFSDSFKHVKAADGQMHKRLPENMSEKYTRYFTALVLSLHIDTVTDAKGRVNVKPDVDQIAYLMDKAPSLEKMRLNDAIARMRVSSVDYENSIDADFLAKP